MTTATEAVRLAGLDMRGMSDLALAEMYADGQQPLSPAAMAECQRRDRVKTRRRAAERKRAAAEAEWMDAAHAHYLRADEATRGNLLAAGSWLGEAFPGLYRLGDRDFDRQASEEMRGFCESEPRPVRRDFIAAAFTPRKGSYPWHEPGWEAVKMSDTTGGLAEFAPAEAGVSQEPRTHSPAGAGVPPAGSGDSGAAERRAARAEQAQEIKGRAATAYTPPSAAPPVPAPARDVAVIEPGAVIPPAYAGQPDAAELLRAVLDEIGLYLTDHVWFTSRAQAIAATGWIGQAAARDLDGDPPWLAYVRLLLTSRQNGSGKSTLGDLARILLQCRAGRASKITAYGLCKVFGTFHEVAIADDAQNIFRSDKAGSELLSLLINGYTIGATWVSGKNDGKVEPAAGPAIIIGTDELITKRAEFLRDLLARSIVLRMERPARYMPQLDWDARARGATLGRALAAVTGALAPQLRAAEIALAKEAEGLAITEGDGGRVAQIWRPLDALARVAGGRWPDAMASARAELGSAGNGLLAASEELDRLRTSGRSFWEE